LGPKIEQDRQDGLAALSNIFLTPRSAWCQENKLMGFASTDHPMALTKVSAPAHN